MPKKKPQLVALKKRSGRFLVRKRGGGYLNGPEKVEFLVKAGLLKAPKPKAKDKEA
jgi:hypothetical protein